MTVFFVKNIENTYPKGRTLKKMYRVRVRSEVLILLLDITVARVIVKNDMKTKKKIDIDI